MSEVLTIADAIALGEILRMAQSCAKVSRMTIDGDVINGTARSVGHENGAYLTRETDVRDGYLRVTTQSGLEAVWPVRELIPEVQETTFVAYDW
jgi:hypothetical protein